MAASKEQGHYPVSLTFEQLWARSSLHLHLHPVLAVGGQHAAPRCLPLGDGRPAMSIPLALWLPREGQGTHCFSSTVRRSRSSFCFELWGLRVLFGILAEEFARCLLKESSGFPYRYILRKNQMQYWLGTALVCAGVVQAKSTRGNFRFMFWGRY